MATRHKAEHANTLHLNLATLGDLSEGFAQATIDASINAAVRDTEDRGDDGKERKVTITVKMKKLSGEAIAVAVEAAPVLPKYLTKPTVGTLTHKDGRPAMAFSSASAENPDQPALPGSDEE